MPDVHRIGFTQLGNKGFNRGPALAKYDSTRTDAPAKLDTALYPSSPQPRTHPFTFFTADKAELYGAPSRSPSPKDDGDMRPPTSGGQVRSGLIVMHRCLLVAEADGRPVAESEARETASGREAAGGCPKSSKNDTDRLGT
jgi:hypothetical protein